MLGRASDLSLKGKLGDLFITHHSLVERCLWDVKSLALWAYPSQGWSSPQDTREPLVGAAEGSRACGGSGQHSGNQPAQVQVSPELVRRLSISNVCFSHYHHLMPPRALPVHPPRQQEWASQKTNLTTSDFCLQQFSCSSWLWGHGIPDSV